MSSNFNPETTPFPRLPVFPIDADVRIGRVTPYGLVAQARPTFLNPDVLERVQKCRDNVLQKKAFSYGSAFIGAPTSLNPEVLARVQERRDHVLQKKALPHRPACDGTLPPPYGLVQQGAIPYEPLFKGPPPPYNLLPQEVSPYGLATQGAPIPLNPEVLTRVLECRNSLSRQEEATARAAQRRDKLVQRQQRHAQNEIAKKQSQNVARATSLIEEEKGKTPYTLYITKVPREEREEENPEHPVTPRVSFGDQKGTFEREYHKWVEGLKAWEARNLSNEMFTLNPVQFQEWISQYSGLK